LLKQYRETKDIQPKNYRCGRHFKSTQEQLLFLGELIAKNNDATLAELAEMFRKETEISLSVTTIHRMSLSLRMTRKKNFTSARKGK
jgi:transposase